jgi:hypothetical protein
MPSRAVSEFDEHSRLGQGSDYEFPKQFGHGYVELGRTDLEGPMDIARQIERETLDPLSGRRHTHGADASKSFCVRVLPFFCVSVSRIAAMPSTCHASGRLW